MKNFEIVIGIEVHVLIDSSMKMFSNAKSIHYANANSCVSYMDIALPGILPSINREVIKKSIILADALNMNINFDNIQFDRKNYFYPDLPKGFQITQQYHPIGINGYLEIVTNNEKKKILLNRVHMEEDTAKQIINDSKILLDFNRAGCPLVEIVSEPCIHSAEEAMQYLQLLRQILIFKDISDAKLEDGSMRADINISIRPLGQKEFGTKVEIKNINSISNVGKAIEFEVKRQMQLLLSNKTIHQETRKFNDSTNTTEFLRDKSNNIDYRYMTEPNIVNFCVAQHQVNEILKKANPHPEAIKKQLESLEFNKSQIEILMNNYEYYALLNLLIPKIQDVKNAYNWIVVELAGLLKKEQIKFNDLNVFFKQQFIELLILLDSQEINSKQAKTLLQHLFLSSDSIATLIQKLNLVQIKDPLLLGSIIDEYIEHNQEFILKNTDRIERIEKTIIGFVMKETNAQANPVIASDILKNKLNSFLSKNKQT